MFSNARCVLSQCNTRIRLLHLLYDIEVRKQKKKKNNKTHFFYVLYSDKTWVFDQSDCLQGPIYIIISINLPIQQYNPYRTRQSCKRNKPVLLPEAHILCLWRCALFKNKQNMSLVIMFLCVYKKEIMRHNHSQFPKTFFLKSTIAFQYIQA